LVRPADHPDFFRLPPPPGRSRESTIRLDRQGRFFHDQEPVTHPGMARAFASWIGRHPDDGRFILNNGWDWTYFEVEEAPFFIDGVEASDERPVLILSDGSREPLDPTTLRTGEAEVLYVRVKGGQFEARFRQAAQIGLAPWLEEAPGGQPSLVIAGARYLLS
jgi:uncharacterized protein